jgi:2-oxoglutarate ferredoxin oxidoreductase subunit gamma
MRHEIRIQGLGGQGVITAGHMIGEAVSLHERKEAIMTEDYSPYVTGGWSRADLVISDEPIDYPLVTQPDILVAMSQDGLDDNWKNTPKGATIIAESSFVKSPSVKHRNLFEVPALSIAEGLGKKVMANIVMLGSLTARTGIVNRDAMESVIANRYPKASELNLQAFTRGFDFFKESTHIQLPTP